jgi:AcrR family transcriptional regulator
MRATRKDGLATRERLVEVASAVFAEKGYRDTTVGQICESAGVNTAAINYHFGGKDELYAAAWRNAFDEVLRAYPPDGGVAADAPVEKRFHGFISALLHRVLSEGRLGHAGSLLVRELTHPTEAIDHVRDEAIRPLHERVSGLIRELLGPSATETDLAFSAMSVIHQCLATAMRTRRLPAFDRYVEIAAADIPALADHIAEFSLAGLAAVRARIDARSSLERRRAR